MLKKKLIAIVAACALTLALPTAAFAADASPDDWSLSSGSTLATLDVSNKSVSEAGFLFTCEVKVPANVGTLTIKGPGSAANEIIKVIDKNTKSEVVSGKLAFQPIGSASQFLIPKMTLESALKKAGNLTLPATFLIKVEDSNYDPTSESNTPPATNDPTTPPAPTKPTTPTTPTDDNNSGSSTGGSTNNSSSDNDSNSSSTTTNMPATNETANRIDNTANNAAKSANSDKTSPKTGMDTNGIALVTIGALAAAGCVAFAIRKKLNINE